MTVWVVPGLSTNNKDLLRDAKRIFPNSKFISYDHWKTGSEINFNLEISKLNFEDDDKIIAKSIGIVLSLKSLIRNNKKVKIFCMGVPLNLSNKINFDILSELKKHSHLIFQNEFDPSGNFIELKKLNSKMIPNNKTHSYSVSDLENEIKNFF